jgi:hypothetical protein
MELRDLPDSVSLGLYWSAIASIMVVPIGTALKSWKLPALIYLLIMMVCVVGHWMVESGGGTRRMAMALAWLAGAALAVSLIGFGVYAIATFEPYCTPSRTLICFKSEDQQRTGNHLSAMLPITGGTILLIVLIAIAVRAFRNRIP